MISVVIPTYDHGALLLETLASVFAQTVEECEIIVVNDGSPDETAELLRPFVETGRVVYLEQQNGGPAAARNRGLEAARGEYVAFLDDDDLWPADKLSWQARVLEENPGAVLVYGRYAQLRADGELQADRTSGFPSGSVYREFRRRNWIHSIGQTLMRTEAIRAIGGFDPDVWGADDWELYIRLARVGSFEFRERLALHYRLHGSNASRSAIQHARGHFRVVRRHIGWNLPLLVSNQRAAAAYFVPNLIEYAVERHGCGDDLQALKACGIALTFRPGLLAKRWVLGLIGRAVLGLVRRPVSIGAVKGVGGSRVDDSAPGDQSQPPQLSRKL